MDLDRIKDLIEILEDTEVSELSIEEDGDKINIKRGYGHNVVKEQPVVHKKLESTVNNNGEITDTNDEEKNKDREEIVAPMVGTFYKAPSPDADPFVEVGDTISKGDVVCIIEAMKLMNEIEADTDCKIVDILVEDGEAIEYGQALFEIEKI